MADADEVLDEQVPAADAEPDEPDEEYVPKTWLGRAYAHRSVRMGIAGGIIVGVLAVWAGRENDQAGAPPPPSNAALQAKPAVEADLAKIAAAAGCTPKQTADNSTYRQAVCQTREARLVLTTFSTDQNQKDWLADAIPYGGAYLVGKRWVVNGNTPLGMDKVAAALGGTIVDKSGEHHG